LLHPSAHAAAHLLRHLLALFLLRLLLRSRKQNHRQVGLTAAVLVVDDDLLRHRGERRELRAHHVASFAR